jgi:hypothetical protein
VLTDPPRAVRRRANDFKWNWLRHLVPVGGTRATVRVISDANWLRSRSDSGIGSGQAAQESLHMPEPVAMPKRLAPTAVALIPGDDWCD